MKTLEYLSVLHGEQQEFLEQLYEKYLKSPESIPQDWRILFDNLDGTTLTEKTIIPEVFLKDDFDIQYDDLNVKVHKLIQDYRRHGHFYANIDPLKLRKTSPTKEEFFDLKKYGISEHDLKRKVKVSIGNKEVVDTVENIIRKMESLYCSTIGFEFFYIRDEAKRNWLIEKVESEEFQKPLTEEEILNIYEKLYRAEYLEKYLGIKFPGKKRFSLEGGEALIPLLSKLIEEAARNDIEQIVIGMAHRGRLNVLANILEKDLVYIFAEFLENVDNQDFMGDVKYHLGYSRDKVFPDGRKVHLSLAFNPSHLEVINPVVMGSVRARQTKNRDLERKRHLGLLIHGDAAICGQGINYELINMTNLEGYTVGGMIHIVINNQIGFTTEPKDGRSTPYATDIGKLLMNPIFHINGDDPVAAIKAVKLAIAYHQTFQTDVFLDFICFRRWGHNETDEPTFTQPVMYKVVKEHPGTFTLFENSIWGKKIPEEKKKEIKTAIQNEFDHAYHRLQSENIKIYIQTLTDQWKSIKKFDFANEPDTSVGETTLRFIAEKVTAIPENFRPNPKVAKLFQERREMILSPDKRKIDWGMGEILAYGTLLLEGFPVRISGQDVKRGTFSHRHAAIYDMETGKEYIPLAHLSPDQATFEIHNSLLSEEAVLGFEYGYSLADPNTLVIWEAQFGDFANGAQVIIDQFITSSEAKWERMSGITLFLPHGYEGQGPEHSSARIERFLQLCSQHNIQVVYPTLPSQIFHILRKQMKRNYRKPLIVMTPKSLLRHPEVVSDIKDFTGGKFLEVIDETDPDIDPEKVTKLIFCSGKIYYELREARRKFRKNHIAIVRIEQLYPFPSRSVKEILSRYPRVEIYNWTQEEPRNQGAWIYMENHLGQLCPGKLTYTGRASSPSPATGFYKVHVKEQEAIIKEAIEL